jgi:hypothetical protein
MDAMTKTTNDHAPERRTCSWVFMEAALRRHERQQRILRLSLCAALLCLAALVVAYRIGGVL